MRIRKSRHRVYESKNARVIRKFVPRIVTGKPPPRLPLAGQIELTVGVSTNSSRRSFDVKPALVRTDTDSVSFANANASQNQSRLGEL